MKGVAFRWTRPRSSPGATPGVATNALALFLAYVLPRGCTFAAGIVAARVLGPERFGAYATAAAIAVVTSIAATLGMQPLLVRELSRDRAAASALVGAAHGVKAITIALMAVLLLGAAFGTGLPTLVGLAALLLGAAYGVGALVDNLSAYFQAVERMYVWTQASALYGIIAGGVGAALVALTGDLLAFCAAPLLGQLAALGWLLAASPPEVRRPHAPRAFIVKPLLRQLAPFAVAFIATTIYYRGDVLLLARFRSDAEVGTYTVARRFLDVAQAVAAAIAAAAYPRLSRNRERREGRTRTGLQLALLAGVPAAGLLLLLREPLVSVLYGGGYSAAIPVLAILAPAIAPLVLIMFCLAARLPRTRPLAGQPPEATPR
jgi:PST family polysaccharide transporter